MTPGRFLFVAAFLLGGALGVLALKATSPAASPPAEAEAKAEAAPADTPIQTPESHETAEPESVPAPVAVDAQPPEAAAKPDLLAQCFTPQALAGTAQEVKTARAKSSLDLAGLRQEPLAPASPVAPKLRGSIRSVELPPGEKLIALTFDLCESSGDTAGYDGRIVDLLRAQGAKATFFAGGKWMESHRERAEQLIADPNFEIAGHGLRHLDFSGINEPTLKDEILLTKSAYARARKALLARQCVTAPDAASALPERMTLVRFPYGRCNAKALQAVADAGLLAIQWDVVTGDPDPHITAKGIARNILANAHPGAIVVAHANGRGRNTAEALAIALPKLKEDGYSFVTVSELLRAGKPVIAASCYLNRPSDKARIAKAGKRRSHDVLSIFRSSH